MQPSGILETALYVTDVETAARFYGDVLGLECILRAGEESVFFRCGPGVLILFNAGKTERTPKRWFADTLPWCHRSGSCLFSRDTG